MPKFLEDRLRAQAASEGLAGRSVAHYVYGTMNKIGAMHGNKETAKGKAMDAKHAKDMAHGRTHPGKNLGAHLHPRRKSR